MQKRLADKRADARGGAGPGSFRAVTGDGDDADLFNLDHYPVHAICRVCSEPIRAEAFLRAFRHEDYGYPEPRVVSRATKARQSPDSAADSDTARCAWPTCPSARSSTGRPDAVACCSAAHIL